MLLVFDCYVAFHFLMVLFIHYVSLRYIMLSLGNRVATFFGKSYQLSLQSIYVVVAKLYFPVFPVMRGLNVDPILSVPAITCLLCKSHNPGSNKSTSHLLPHSKRYHDYYTGG